MRAWQIGALAIALFIVSVFIIPPLLVGMGVPVKIVYIVPLAICMVIAIRRFDGSKPRRRDQLAEAFGVWMAQQITRAFGLKPRRKVPTTRDRVIGTVVGTAVAACLVATVYFTRSGPQWYGILALAWLVSMVVTWIVDRPNLQVPNDTK
ncbi:MAG: hypothetical protein DI528_05435 [Shinella sp.]|nr:MAG: hypothetical protein DI528_05435 [Shinella sp.]